MSLSSGVRAVSTLMEAASEQRLLPQGSRGAERHRLSYPHAAYDNPCGHRVISSLSPVQLARG